MTGLSKTHTLRFYEEVHYTLKNPFITVSRVFTSIPFFALSFLGCAFWLVCGCASERSFWCFQVTVTQQEKLQNGSWRTRERTNQEVVVGPGYVRVTSRKEGGKAVLQIYDERKGDFWKVEAGKANLWPVEEVFERIANEFVYRRWRAREKLAAVSPLLRPSAWRFFSGDPSEMLVSGNGPVLFGFPTRRVKIGLFPGVLCEACVPTPARAGFKDWHLFFFTLGVPRKNLQVLRSVLGALPFELNLLSISKKERIRHLVVQKPHPCAPESPSDLIPKEVMERLRAREQKLSSGGALLRMMDGEKGPPGVTLLGACVRFARKLNRRNVQSVIKRFEALKERECRRYLMKAAARVAPYRAVSRLIYLAKYGPLEVAMDSAWALSEILPPQKAVLLVGEVLRRAWKATPEELRSQELKREIYLWATDLLRELTGKDWGFWPNVEEEGALRRWLDYLSELREGSGQNIPSLPPSPADNFPSSAGLHSIPEPPSFSLP